MSDVVLPGTGPHRSQATKNRWLTQDTGYPIAQNWMMRRSAGKPYVLLDS